MAFGPRRTVQVAAALLAAANLVTRTFGFQLSPFPTTPSLIHDPQALICLSAAPQSTSSDESNTRAKASEILFNFDRAQASYAASGKDTVHTDPPEPVGIEKKDNGLPAVIDSDGRGPRALEYIEKECTVDQINEIRSAVTSLVTEALETADYRRKNGVEKKAGGRVMLGFVAGSIDDGLTALKSWVGTMKLPRGRLHGMDIDGVPNPPKGPVYIKYSSGEVLTFTDLRQRGMSLMDVWKPGDAVVDEYAGEYRGVYLNVELEDKEFRQFGVLPLGLFGGSEKK
uniref:Uncharacterized protein n=1 Tax=Heterosigma akashiwo TaxID=2829 RepID=A0A6S9JC07_HETAK